MAVQTQIQTRRGTAATWTSTNPTLAAGEIGFESDTNKFKIGTGSTAWTALAYAANTSPLTTKGDLYTYSTTNDRLPVGANGETIVADSSTSTGLRYQAPVNVNPVLNSAFQIFQRGTSTAISTAAYVADRWQGVRSYNATGTTFSQQATNDATNLPFIQYCMRVQRDNGNTGTYTSYFVQSFETINSIPYAGKSVTYSFYARKGANYSATSSGLGVIVAQGTGTDQNLLTVGYTGGTNLISNTVTLTSTWQRFTLTGSVASTTKELGLMFTFDPTGTAGANDYYEITGVQLEVGSVATPFKTYAGTIQGELAACQRYYFRASGSSNSDNYGTISGFGLATGTSNVQLAYQLPVTMRTGATSIDYANFSVYGGGSGGAGFVSVSSASLIRCTPNFAEIIILTNGTVTTGAVYRLQNNNSSGSYFGLSAEL